MLHFETIAYESFLRQEIIYEFTPNRIKFELQNVCTGNLAEREKNKLKKLIQAILIFVLFEKYFN